jgi:hypothetical protein
MCDLRAISLAIIVVLIVIAACIVSGSTGIAIIAAIGCAAATGCAAAIGYVAATDPVIGGAWCANLLPDAIEYCGSSYSQSELDIIRALPSRHPLSAIPTTIDDLKAITWRQSSHNYRNHHAGQRKLLMSEVDFLSNYARKGDTIVYAGAAPGTHIPFLASLFPDIQFILVDPRQFKYKKLGKPIDTRIETRQQLFLDKDALEFAGRDDVLFISDIRAGTEDADIPSEATVSADMGIQRRWVEMMQPRASMLKFRLKYGNSSPDYEYLDGVVRLQVWPPGTSSETRLISTRPYAIKTYNPNDYDEKMYYYNKIIRMWAKYDHGVSPTLVAGIDDCAGCALEVHMWNRYLAQVAKVAPAPAGVADLMNRASKALGRSLEVPSHAGSQAILQKCMQDRVDAD